MTHQEDIRITMNTIKELRAKGYKSYASTENVQHRSKTIHFSHEDGSVVFVIRTQLIGIDEHVVTIRYIDPLGRMQTGTNLSEVLIGKFV